MSRSDPIGDKYFKPLQQVEATVEVLFYLAAALSLAALLVSRAQDPALYDGVQIAFVLVVLIGSLLGLVARFYLSPRATSKRSQDLPQTPSRCR